MNILSNEPIMKHLDYFFNSACIEPEGFVKRSNAPNDVIEKDDVHESTLNREELFILPGGGV